MTLSFSPSSIFASLIFSGIGYWLYREGRRRANMPIVVIGVLMMFYTYFTPSPLFDWGVGIALCLAAKQFWE